MEKKFLEFAGVGLQKARQMGADSAELFMVKKRSLEVEIKDGSLDEIKQADSQGVGLRIIKGNRQGFSFSSDFSETVNPFPESTFGTDIPPSGSTSISIFL